MVSNDLRELLPAYRVFTIEELKDGSYEFKAPDNQIYDGVISKYVTSLSEAFETQCIKFGKSFTPHQDTTTASYHNSAQDNPQATKPAPAQTKAQAQAQEQVQASAQAQAVAQAPSAAQAQAQEHVLASQGTLPDYEQVQGAHGFENHQGYQGAYDVPHEQDEEMLGADPDLLRAQVPDQYLEQETSFNGDYNQDNSDLDEFDLNSLVSIIDDYNHLHQSDHNHEEIHQAQAQEPACSPDHEPAHESVHEPVAHSDYAHEALANHDFGFKQKNEHESPFGDTSLMPDSPFSVMPHEPRAQAQSQVQAQGYAQAQAQAQAMPQAQAQAQGYAQAQAAHAPQEGLGVGMGYDQDLDINELITSKVANLIRPYNCAVLFDKEQVNHKRLKVLTPNGREHALFIYHRKNLEISKVQFNKVAFDDSELLEQLAKLLTQNLVDTYLFADSPKTNKVNSIEQMGSPWPQGQLVSITPNSPSLLSAPMEPNMANPHNQGQGFTSANTVGTQQDERKEHSFNSPYQQNSLSSGGSPWEEALVQEKAKLQRLNIQISKPEAAKASLYRHPELNFSSGLFQDASPNFNPTANVSPAPKEVWSVAPQANTQAKQKLHLDDRVSNILLPLGFKVKFLQSVSYQQQYEVATQSGDSCILMIFYKSNNKISNIRFNKTPKADKAALASAAMELNKQLLGTNIF